MTPPLRKEVREDFVYALNFLLSATSPSNPEPRRSMVEGSGTAEMVRVPALP